MELSTDIYNRHTDIPDIHTWQGRAGQGRAGQSRTELTYLSSKLPSGNKMRHLPLQGGHAAVYHYLQLGRHTEQYVAFHAPKEEGSKNVVQLWGREGRQGRAES